MGQSLNKFHNWIHISIKDIRGDYKIEQKKNPQATKNVIYSSWYSTSVLSFTGQTDKLMDGQGQI